MEYTLVIVTINHKSKHTGRKYEYHDELCSFTCASLLFAITVYTRCICTHTHPHTHTHTHTHIYTMS